MFNLLKRFSLATGILILLLLLSGNAYAQDLLLESFDEPSAEWFDGYTSTGSSSVLEATEERVQGDSATLWNYTVSDAASWGGSAEISLSPQDGDFFPDLTGYEAVSFQYKIVKPVTPIENLRFRFQFRIEDNGIKRWQVETTRIHADESGEWGTLVIPFTGVNPLEGGRFLLDQIKHFQFILYTPKGAGISSGSFILDNLVALEKPDDNGGDNGYNGDLNGDEELVIWVPRRHNPVFVEPGGSFHAEIRGSSSLDTEGWSATLCNDLKTWGTVVDSVKRGGIHHETETGWNVWLSVPADIPPELMQLNVFHTSALADHSFRSVHIVPDFEEDFYIFHQSDHHVTNEKAVIASGRASATWGNGSQESMEWITETVNLANPRFMFYTGDNNQIYNSATSWAGFEEAKRMVERFFAGMAGYTVPSVITNGNHDIGYSSYDNFQLWRDQYKEQVGQTVFSFRMGSFYTIINEWTVIEYLNWVRNDYLATFDDPTIKYRLVASHYYNDPWSETVPPSFPPADLKLIGHNHQTRVARTSPFRILSVNAAQNYQLAAFFNFRRTQDGWNSPEVLTHANGVNVHQLHGDWGLKKLWADYTHPNDGSQYSNAASITNQFPHDFYNGRVRFLMAPGVDEYAVQGGVVLAQYDSDDGTATVVLVRVNIEKNGVTDVTISGKPTSSELDERPKQFILEQNYPNPFNPVTQIRYQLPEGVHVTLEVYSVTGQRVRTLVNEYQAGGTHTATFDAANLSSGMYFYCLEAGSFRDTKSMMFIK